MNVEKLELDEKHSKKEEHYLKIKNKVFEIAQSRGIKTEEYSEPTKVKGKMQKPKSTGIEKNPDALILEILA